MKRTPVSKKIRFEVFKRDKFTCQYCGRSAPDVILEVDHLKPVADGGENDILNLITSCRDCNRGKGKRSLSDSAVIEKQRSQLAELSEKREQLKMMLEWRESLRSINQEQIRAICSEFYDLTGYRPDIDNFRFTDNINRVESWLKSFSLTEIMDAMDISVGQYYRNTRQSAITAFHKIGGICYNRKNQSDKKYQLNFLRKCCINNFGEYDEEILQKIVNSIDTPLDFKYIIDDLKQRDSWEDFMFGNYDPSMDEDGCDE